MQASQAGGAIGQGVLPQQLMHITVGYACKADQHGNDTAKGCVLLRVIPSEAMMTQGGLIPGTLKA